MTSITVDIDIEDHLDEVVTSALAHELRTRIKAGERVEKEAVDALFEQEDQEALGEALWRFQRGEITEALFRLECVLGAEWFGLSDAVAAMLRRAA